MSDYRLRDVGMRYDQTWVLREVSVAFSSSQLTTIIGPNGAGKSTLLGIMAGLRDSYSGECLYQDRDLRAWSRRDFTRRVSFVPQSLQVEFPFSVEQVVYMGRTPHAEGWFESDDDEAAVEHALALTDTVAFRHRDFRSLSGGERQRVVLAAALAQSPRVLLLDEPTNFLDLSHQVALFSLLRDLCRQGLLVVAITHDLNLALRYSDRLLLLQSGRVVADGPPAEVLSPDRIHDVFAVSSQLLTDAEGRAWIGYGH